MEKWLSIEKLDWLDIKYVEFSPKMGLDGKVRLAQKVLIVERNYRNLHSQCINAVTSMSFWLDIKYVEFSPKKMALDGKVRLAGYQIG